METIYWDHSYNAVLLVNLIIVIGLFACLRIFSGTISHINATDELIKKDNPAFGISLAGVTFAVTMLLSGTIYGDPQQDTFNSAIAVGLYGLVGIAFMALTRVIFDKIALPHISLRDEIVKGNIAVAIADTGNVLAAAIIIRAIIIWVSHNSIEALASLFVAYAVSQIVLTAATFIKLRLFKAVHKNYSIEEELQNGNIALALSFAGRKMSTALAIAMASELVVYEVHNISSFILSWAFVSVVIILIVNALAFAAKRIVLFRINVSDEILRQRNIAIGAVEGVIYIAMAILLAEL